MERLIDAYSLFMQFCVNKDGKRIPEVDCNNFPVTIPIKDVKDIIRNHPTAYDVENVVEELEDLKDGYEHSCIDNAYQRGAEDGAKWLKKKAIEIVKQGCVSDDVCEWMKYDYKTIRSPHERDWSIPSMKDFKYCPYCSKKIKVVE